MTPARTRLRLAALAAGLLAPLPFAAAQDRPRAFLSASPTGDTPAENVDVRPNTDQAYSVWVENNGREPYKNFRVTIAADADGNRPIAKGALTNVTIGPKEKRRVKLTPAVEPPPPPPAPAPGTAPATPPAVPAGITIDGQLFLILEVYGDDNATLVRDGRTSTPVAARIRPPSDYLTITPVKPTQAGVNDIVVEVSGKTFPPDQPARVRLDVRPDLFSRVDPDSLKDGTYEALVPPGGKGYLIARNLRLLGSADLTDATAIFSVSADGYNRARSFRTNFRGDAATDLEQTRLLITAPRYAQPGKPVTVKMEAFRDVPLGESGRFKLLFYRSGLPNEAPQVLADKRSLRDETLSVKTNPAGDLVLGSVVKDWEIPLDTAGVYGTRKLELKVEGVAGVEPTTTKIVLDDTPPVGVNLIKMPVSKVRGTELEVTAEGLDPESGVKEVLFYIGEPPSADGKPAPNGAVAPGVRYALTDKDGKPLPNARPVYFARFDLPDVKGKVKVGVRFVNNVGLVTDSRPFDLRLVDPKLPRTVGDIKVKVTQGSDERPQPRLTVTLRDQTGTPLDTRETSDKGEATFKDLKPGSYYVTTVKPADQNASAFKLVTVVADKETATQLEVKRQPSASYPLPKR